MNGSSDESEGQGFYKPTFTVTQHLEVEPPTIQFEEQQMDDANAIVTEDRPIDFKPRILTSMGQHYCYHEALDDISLNHGKGQQMIAIPYNRVNRDKQTRYASLQAKYKNNEKYKLVYSKLENVKEYSSYFFSLQNTTDFNPNDYSPFSPQYCPQNHIFDSRFQSGNLLYAYQKVTTQQTPEYDLIMHNDTNTKGYCQWFFFLVRNQSHKKIRINIVNFIKKRLMFLDGVRPVGFSVKQSENNGKGWDFMGENVYYNKSYITREIQSKDGSPPTYRNYYTLSFDINFQNTDDTVYLALNYPYTYSKMIKFIDEVVQNCPEDVLMDKNILCHTISNNAIPYIKIRHKDNFSKNTIFLIGRQHPGETVGSYVLEGFVKELIRNNKFLLKKYEFIVIPMINPDGVIYGNFRTNLAGFDLNRQWLVPNRWLHPQVYFVTRTIFNALNVEFCIDFHGHSKKLNSFIYACTDEKMHEFRVYPYVYSKCCKLFSAPDCTYNITLDKMKTCRVRVFNEIKKSFVYTLQTSFFGHNKNAKNTRFQFADLFQIGRGGAEALGKLFADKKSKLKYEQEVRDKSFLFQQWAILNREDYGSQSNPSEDQLNPIERKKKVMSDVNASKTDKKNQRKKNLPKKESRKKKVKQKDQFRFVLKQKADSATIFDKKPQKILPKNSDKKIDSGVIVIQQQNKKSKQLPSTYLQPKFKAPIPLPPKPQQVKTMNLNATYAKKQKTESEMPSSNLFDTARFFQLRDQSFKKKEEQKLQVSNLKSNPNKTIHDKNLIYGANKKSSIKKMHLEEPKLVSQPKKKNRQKVYIIKENKIVNSITRINEDEVKKQIEREISSRTMLLKNCQRIMNTAITENRHLSMESPHDRWRKDEQCYKTKKLLKPLDMRRHKNFNSVKEERHGIFFSFL